MTEQEWLQCTNSARMLEFQRRNLSNRKLRLFICACGRRAWLQLTDKRSRRAVEIGERFADGTTKKKDVEAALANAKAAVRESRLRLQDSASRAPSQENEEFQLVLHAEEAARFAQKAVEADAWRAAMEVADTWATSERMKSYLSLHDLIANPFRPIALEPSWVTSTVEAIATAIYEEKAFDRLPILADALEDAGCNQQDILQHLRQPSLHTRGCWPLDLVLGKE